MVTAGKPFLVALNRISNLARGCTNHFLDKEPQAGVVLLALEPEDCRPGAQRLCWLVGPSRNTALLLSAEPNILAKPGLHLLL